jgi:hypothetical protein
MYAWTIILIMWSIPASNPSQSTANNACLIFVYLVVKVVLPLLSGTNFSTVWVFYRILGKQLTDWDAPGNISTVHRPIYKNQTEVVFWFCEYQEHMWMIAWLLIPNPPYAYRKGGMICWYITLDTMAPAWMDCSELYCKFILQVATTQNWYWSISCFVMEQIIKSIS